MNQSETIGKLAEALCKAQAVIEGAKKDSNNPFFRSKYADLASVWDACRKPLTDNGLSIVQSPVFVPEHPDMIGLDTRLCHSSGEWLEGRIVMKPVKSDPQSYGSCLTYLRRYSLQSLVSVCPEDDDGNLASGMKPEKAEKPMVKKAVVADVPDFADEPPMPEPTYEVESSVMPPPPNEPEENIHVIKPAGLSIAKSGEKNGKVWHKYQIVSATGSKYSTFSKSIADRMEAVKASGDMIPIRVKETKFGNEIESIVA
jgi:hypothetical protein